MCNHKIRQYTSLSRIYIYTTTKHYTIGIIVNRYRVVYIHHYILKALQNTTKLVWNSTNTQLCVTKALWYTSSHESLNISFTIIVEYGNEQNTCGNIFLLCTSLYPLMAGYNQPDIHIFTLITPTALKTTVSTTLWSLNPFNNSVTHKHHYQNIVTWLT